MVKLCDCAKLSIYRTMERSHGVTRGDAVCHKLASTPTKDSLIMAMEVDQTYVTLATFGSMVTIQTDA
jgi:hypothetical protein